MSNGGQPVIGWVDKGDGIHAALAAQGIKIWADASTGIVYSNNAVLALQINQAFDYVADRKAAKLLDLANFRWLKETGGIVVGGLQIDTTDRSKTLITGALIVAQADPSQTFDFKTVDGAYKQIDAATMVGIYQAVAKWVQTCFANEQVVAAQINALKDVQAVIDFDLSANWPK